MSHDEEYDTTVLSDDYSDYRDTVVDQVIAFDPSLFQGAQGEMAQQAQRPTWVSAGSAAMAQAQASPAPTAKPASTAKPAPQPVHSRPQPTWTQANSASSAPANFNPDEDTWVLGVQQPGGAPPMQSATAATMAAAPNYPPAQYAAPAPSSTWQVAPSATPAMMAAADRKPVRANPLLIGVIIGLAIVGVIAIVVALVLAFGPKESSKPADSSSVAAVPVVVAAPSSSASGESEEAVQSASARSEESKSAKSSEVKNDTGPKTPIAIEGGSGGVGSIESDFYESLKKYYNEAGELDKSVRSCAQDFNNTYLKEDMSLRSSKAGAASSLESRIKSSSNALGKLLEPYDSPNAQAYKDICELYECLEHRIDVINKAWEISLRYEKPKDHESEILVPIRAQQSGGNDRYYTRFNELYPKVNLVKP